MPSGLFGHHRPLWVHPGLAPFWDTSRSYPCSHSLLPLPCCVTLGKRMPFLSSQPLLQSAGILTPPSQLQGQHSSWTGLPQSAQWEAGTVGCPQLGTSPHWQDEMELGYVQAPHKTFPVVFDSPRNGELQEFPYKRILVSATAAGGPGSQPRDHAGADRDSLGSLFSRDEGWGARHNPGGAQSRLNFREAGGTFGYKYLQMLHGTHLNSKVLFTRNSNLMKRPIF